MTTEPIYTLPDDYYWEEDEEELPPGARQCPYCGHMYYDDCDGCSCSACRLGIEDEENEL